MEKNSLVLLSILIIASVVNSVPVIPKEYQLYKQCNSSWANNVMGVDRYTICEDGCAMSDVSMGLYSHNILVGGQEANPATLNEWLQTNNGYVNGSNLNLAQPEKISPGVKFVKFYYNESDIPRNQLIKNLEGQTMVQIAWVCNHTHFVLVKGYDTENEDIYYVNDPFYNRTSYNRTEIVGWLVYDMKEASQNLFEFVLSYFKSRSKFLF